MEERIQTVAAVVVTFNRFELLKKCIQSLREQTRKPNEIIVVNNASTDGTFEWLIDQKDVTVVNQENLGGAGGFYTGIKTAYEKGYDWAWCMDDDVIPNKEALEELVKYKKSKRERIGFLASRVLWTDGTQCVMNQYPPEVGEATDRASFVSIIISREAIKAVGYPIKEFFIYYDDAEYTTRIAAKFNCYYVYSSIVFHLREVNDTISWSKITIQNSDKYFFAIRNYIYLFRIRITKYGIWKSVIEIMMISGKAIAGIIIPAKPNKMKLLFKLLHYIYLGFIFNPTIETVIDP